MIKGLAHSLGGALKSPANDKVFVLIARGTTEDTERERFLLSFVAFGGQLRDARLVGAQKEAGAKKCFENIIHIRRHRHKIILLRGKSSTMRPSGISSFRVNCKCIAQSYSAPLSSMRARRETDKRVSEGVSGAHVNSLQSQSRTRATARAALAHNDKACSECSDADVRGAAQRPVRRPAHAHIFPQGL